MIPSEKDIIMDESERERLKGLLYKSLDSQLSNLSEINQKIKRLDQEIGESNNKH